MQSQEANVQTSLSWGVVFGLREDTHLHGLEYQNLSSFFCKSHLPQSY